MTAAAELAAARLAAEQSGKPLKRLSSTVRHASPIPVVNGEGGAAGTGVDVKYRPSRSRKTDEKRQAGEGGAKGEEGRSEGRGGEGRDVGRELWFGERWAMGRISCLSNRGTAAWMGYSCMCQESYPLGIKTLIVVCQSSPVVPHSSRSDYHSIRCRWRTKLECWVGSNGLKSDSSIDLFDVHSGNLSNRLRSTCLPTGMSQGIIVRRFRYPREHFPRLRKRY